MTEVLFKGICAYGRGYHGPVQLYIDDAKSLVLMVGNKLAWSSSFIEPSPSAIDATGWAEAAFDPPTKSEAPSGYTVKNWQGAPGDPWNGKTVTFEAARPGTQVGNAIIEMYDGKGNRLSVEEEARQANQKMDSGGQWRYDELRWHKDNK